jgi:hypothetical protein
MSERKGITVMMLGLIIGIVLLIAFVVFVILFHKSDLFKSILDGFRQAIPLAQHEPEYIARDDGVEQEQPEAISGSFWWTNGIT